jgi:hypothetical protein
MARTGRRATNREEGLVQKVHDNVVGRLARLGCKRRQEGPSASVCLGREDTVDKQEAKGAKLTEGRDEPDAEVGQQARQKARSHPGVGRAATGMERTGRGPKGEEGASEVTQQG